MVSVKAKALETLNKLTEEDLDHNLSQGKFGWNSARKYTGGDKVSGVIGDK